MTNQQINLQSWARTLLVCMLLAMVAFAVKDCQGSIESQQIIMDMRSDFTHRCEKAGGINVENKCLSTELLIDVPLKD